MQSVFRTEPSPLSWLPQTAAARMIRDRDASCRAVVVSSRPPKGSTWNQLSPADPGATHQPAWTLPPGSLALQPSLLESRSCCRTSRHRRSQFMSLPPEKARPNGPRFVYKYAGETGELQSSAGMSNRVQMTGHRMDLERCDMMAVKSSTK